MFSTHVIISFALLFLSLMTLFPFFLSFQHYFPHIFSIWHFDLCFPWIFNNSTIFMCYFLAILFLFCLSQVWGWDRLWGGSVWFPVPSEPVKKAQKKGLFRNGCCSLNHPPLTLTLLHIFHPISYFSGLQYINGKLILLKKWGTFAIQIFIFRRTIKPNSKSSYEYSESYIASWVCLWELDLYKL